MSLKFATMMVTNHRYGKGDYKMKDTSQTRLNLRVKRYKAETVLQTAFILWFGLMVIAISIYLQLTYG